QSALGECLGASGVLAGEGWMSRLHTGGIRGAGETFIAEIYQHVLARNDTADRAYAIEADTEQLDDALIDAARQLASGLKRLIAPLLRLSQSLRKRLDSETAKLETSERARIDAATRGLERRAKLTLPSWIAMLDSLE